jgi:predicted transcriptional regulator of viral defense system
MKPSKLSKKQTVTRLASKQGVIRPRDLDRLGIARTYLHRLGEEGVLYRVARATYRLADYPVTEHATLVEAARRVPNGVACLLSALQFHEIGTQMSPQVWMAIDRKAWKPRASGIPIRFVRFSGFALTRGVEKHCIEGVTVRVYSPAKTVADCFKYRYKVGLDVALEALEECRRSRKCSNDDLWRFAKICRVERVMRPYMEAIR